MRLKFPSKATKQNLSLKNKQARTFESTVFELAFLVMAIITWALIIWLWARAPETVPTHFNAAGVPNDWSSKSSALIPCGITTLVGIIMMASAYFPQSVNVPVTVKTPQQTHLSLRMVRILALLMLPLTLTIATAMYTEHHQMWPTVVITGVMVAVALVFCVLIHRAR